MGEKKKEKEKEKKDKEKKEEKATVRSAPDGSDNKNLMMRRAGLSIHTFQFIDTVIFI